MDLIIIQQLNAANGVFLHGHVARCPMEAPADPRLVHGLTSRSADMHLIKRRRLAPDDCVTLPPDLMELVLTKVRILANALLVLKECLWSMPQLA
jgi:hypothetical protein